MAAKKKKKVMHRKQKVTSKARRPAKSAKTRARKTARSKSKDDGALPPPVIPIPTASFTF